METYVWTSDDGLGDCVVVAGKDVMSGLGDRKGPFGGVLATGNSTKTPKNDRHRTKCSAIINLDNAP